MADNVNENVMTTEDTENTGLQHIDYGDTVEQVFAKTNDAFDKVNQNEQGVKNLDKTILDAKTNGVTGVTHESLKARLDADSQLIKELDGKHDNDVNSLERNVTQNIENINNKVNNLLVQNQPTEGNSELIDIRTGADGKTYPTAGEAVRGQIGSLSEDIDKNKNEIYQYDKKLTETKETGFWQNGEYYEGTEYFTTYRYDVSKCSEVSLSLYVSRYYDVYVFLDENNNTIEYLYANNIEGNNEYELIVPSKAKSLVVCGTEYNLSIGTLVYGKSSQIEENKSQIEENKSQIEELKGKIKDTFWKGKKIVWFGTSIPAGGYIGLNTEKNYPKMVGEILGADVINEAVGESCIACKREWAEGNENNPYNFSNDFKLASRCLTNTVEEMEWICDNYNNGWFTKNKPQSISEQTRNEIISFSYEQKLIKYLTEESFPDLFVFDHGYNENIVGEPEYNAQKQLYETGTKPLYTFFGGMDFLLNLIFSYRPDAKIIIMAHYSNQSRPYVCEAQNTIARNWQLPINRLYEKTGWSERTITTTFGWVDGYWVNKEEDQTITLKNANIADGIHPHTDLSGKALERIARIDASYINNYMM